MYFMFRLGDTRAIICPGFLSTKTVSIASTKIYYDFFYV